MPITAGRLYDGPNMTVWYSHACRKVFPTDRAPSARSEAVRLSQARSEREAVQVVLRPKRELAAPRVKVSALRGPATIGAKQISVRWVAYVNVRRPSGALGKAGLHPDPLPARAPAKLAAGKNQPVWIEVHAPDDQQAGKYRGKIEVSAGGQAVCQIPLNVHVWDFALPPTRLKVKASIRLSALQRDSGRSQEDIVKRYQRNLVAHGVNVSHASVSRHGRGWENHDCSVQFLRSIGAKYFAMPLGGVKHDRRHRWLPDATWALRNPMAAMGERLPRAMRVAAPDGKDFDPKFRGLLERIVRKVSEHYEQLGLLDCSHVRFIDEPDLRDRRTVEWILRVSRLIKGVNPKVRIFHTRAPIPELIPWADVWMVNTALWDMCEKQIELGRKAGHEIWVYQNSIPLIDYSPMRTRTHAWALWKYRVDGVGSWWTLTDWRGDPWQNPAQGPWAGGGILLYPPRDRNEQGPIDSVRWEVWRDGLEDYRLLELAQSLAGKSAELRKLLAEADQVCPKWPAHRQPDDAPHWTDPAKLESLRFRLAAAIEGRLRVAE